MPSGTKKQEGLALELSVNSKAEEGAKGKDEEKVINVSQNYLPNIIILNLSAALAAEFAMYPK